MPIPNYKYTALRGESLMNKKAQGISINVIIIAAIALLVLVILSVIFMGRMGTFGTTSKDCIAQGGQCLDACGGDHPTPYSAWTCTGVNAEKSCCISAGA